MTPRNFRSFPERLTPEDAIVAGVLVFGGFMMLLAWMIA